MASYDAVSAIYWAKNRLNFLRGIVPRALRRRIFRFFFERAIARLPSRSFMSAAILPALVAAGAKKMLFVGTQSYNRAFFRACETAGIAVWSIDLEPGAARFGSPRGHFVDDMRLSIERFGTTCSMSLSLTVSSVSGLVRSPMPMPLCRRSRGSPRQARCWF